jgi:hypothetical protein
VRRSLQLVPFLALAIWLAGCGLQIQEPDLFLITRTGQGKTLTLLVNDSGTISCNGGKTKMLPDPLLIQARDLAQNLDSDATAKLKISRTPDSVYFYTIKLADGTIQFPDTAGPRQQYLAQAELFAVQTAQQACGLSG